MHFVYITSIVLEINFCLFCNFVCFLNKARNVVYVTRLVLEIHRSIKDLAVDHATSYLYDAPEVCTGVVVATSVGSGTGILEGAGVSTTVGVCVATGVGASVGSAVGIGFLVYYAKPMSIRH